ncbi:MAG: ZIP family metal transporter [bacterium]
MHMTLMYLAFATTLATFVGGMFALRHKDKFHIILGFSAGAVIGLAFFDLLPESITLGGMYYPVSYIAWAIAGGFISYMILDRIFIKDSHDHHGHTDHETLENPMRGSVRASSLILHSVLDGICIGFGFQLSPAIGTLIAIGVLGHDFSDGINTVQAVLHSNFSKRQILYWLIADSLAPLLGIGVTLCFHIPEKILGLILAVFCGFFIYIGASDLVPESYHNHPKWLTTAMTVFGAGFVFILIHLIG